MGNKEWLEVRPRRVQQIFASVSQRRSPRDPPITSAYENPSMARLTVTVRDVSLPETFVPVQENPLFYLPAWMKDLFPEASGGILAAKMAHFRPKEATPESLIKVEEEDTFTPTVHGDIYKINLRPDRLLRCSETGIMFMVKSQANIEYNLKYGREYLDILNEKKYELVGPLFNIKVVPPGVVTLVYLPHYVYLEGLSGDTAIIKCGHFKDEKLNLITPLKIESSYIVLKNPSFSCVAAVTVPSFFGRKRRTPISGSVLLYCNILCPHKEECKEYRTHLYLVPTNQPELKKLDKEKKEEGFKKISKPFKTGMPVYNGKQYKVESTNAKASIIPKDMKFKYNCKIENCCFTEINEPGSVTSISLALAQAEGPDKDKSVWIGQLTRGDLEELSEEFTRKMEKGTTSEEHFVIKHREDLIQSIICVDPVLDALLERKLLDHEYYTFVRSKETSHEKMRALYGSVKGWGKEHLDEFYKALKKYNGPVIKNMESQK